MVKTQTFVFKKSFFLTQVPIYLPSFLTEKESLTFREIHHRGGPWKPIARHTSVSDGKNIYIVGGYDGIDTFHEVNICRFRNLISSYQYLISKQALFTYLKHSALNQTEEVTPLRRLSVVNCTNLLSIAFLTSFTDISTAEALLSRTRNPTIRRNGTKHSETFTPLTSVLDCHISPLISLDTLMWTCLDTIVTGDIPTPRSGHKMVSFGKQIFLFGGGVWDSVWFEKFSDTYIFDTEKLSWSKPGMLSKNMV